MHLKPQILAKHIKAYQKTHYKRNVSNERIQLHNLNKQVLFNDLVLIAQKLTTSQFCQWLFFSIDKEDAVIEAAIYVFGKIDKIDLNQNPFNFITMCMINVWRGMYKKKKRNDAMILDIALNMGYDPSLKLRSKKKKDLDG